MALSIAFAGTPKFAVPCLQALIDSEHTIKMVYTQPDRKKGRGQHLTPSPIKQAALAAQLPIHQPLSLRNPEEVAFLEQLSVDVMIVVAYGLILPENILALPRYGCLNVHASLLPRWRGAAPIQRAIAAGDKQTGVTIMQMDAGLDTGDMLLKRECVISEADTSASLQQTLATLGADALIETLEALEQQALQPVAQAETKATYAKKIAKSEAVIDWQKPAHELDCLIRAFQPWPITQTQVQGTTVRIHQATIVGQDSQQPPGTLIASEVDGLVIACGEGCLRLQTIQLPGKKALTVKDVLNAHADLFSPGTVLGND